MRKIYSIEDGCYANFSGPMATLNDGRVLWITQGPEWPREVFHLVYAELRESRDNGLSWSKPKVIIRGTKKTSPLIWRLIQLKSGKLFLIGTHDGGEDLENQENSLNSGFTMISEDGGENWSEPRDIYGAERYLGPGLACAIQLGGGRIVFPFAYYTGNSGHSNISAVFSDDEGEIWQRSVSNIDIGGSGYESGAEEPSIVELPDGKLWLLIRSQSGFLWESFSQDQGVTWEPAQPTRLPSGNAPASILKLRDGRIVIIWNNTVASKGSRAYARQNLVMAVTRDGKNFYGFREIVHTEYPVSSEIYWSNTYAFLTEAPDGTILASFNYGNWDVNQVKLARINPGWIEERSFREDFRQGRKDWCTLGIGPIGSCLKPSEDDQPGAVLEVGRWAPESGIVRNFPLLESGEFTLNANVIRPEAYFLWHNSFLLPGDAKEAILRIRFASGGKIFIGTGHSETYRTDRGHAHKMDFSCPSYPVRKEVSYPVRMEYGQSFTVRIKCSICEKEARVSFNQGPEVKLPLAEILGLCYFGIATANKGIIRVRKFETVTIL